MKKRILNFAVFAGIMITGCFVVMAADLLDDDATGAVETSVTGIDDAVLSGLIQKAYNEKPEIKEQINALVTEKIKDVDLQLKLAQITNEALYRDYLTVLMQKEQQKEPKKETDSSFKKVMSYVYKELKDALPLRDIIKYAAIYWFLYQLNMFGFRATDPIDAVVKNAVSSVLPATCVVGPDVSFWDRMTGHACDSTAR